MQDLATKLGRKARVDLLLIAEMVSPGARVIDVGCGDGELLELLAAQRNVDGRGVEIERERVNQCVARGLSVIQGDADADLESFPDDAFDYALLSLTIQAIDMSSAMRISIAASRPVRRARFC